MSIQGINLEQRNPVAGPNCEACGTVTRLVGIEPHPRLVGSDIRTFVCTACEAEQIIVVPRANGEKRSGTESAAI